jgi:protein-disulfide isomerase
MNKLLLGTAMILTFVSSAIMAKDLSRDDVEQIIRDYIQNNPEVILDSVESYGEQQQKADVKNRQKSVEKHMGWLENNAMLPVAGNPNGDVTIVEFFDYNCGYCKKALGDVVTLMEEDKNVKFIFVETPILGNTSELAAKWAMAAQKQDAYMEYHIGLMKHRGPINETSLEKVAKKVGLDVQKLRDDANSDDVANKVAEKSRKAAQMGISGTPAFIINGKLYGGYIGLDKMREAIKDARSEG